MLSVLSVPMMVAGSQPTMLTVDMAFRINAYGDAVANAPGVISYLITARLGLFASQPARRATTVARSFGVMARAALLAMLAFALIGPLANLVLWSIAERWYAPHKLPVTYGLRYWEIVFRPTGDAMGSLMTSVSIAAAVVVVALVVSVPAGYALARLRLPFRAAIMIASCCRRHSSIVST
jgi:ABC-type Fe3+ transport system permease subunit